MVFLLFFFNISIAYRGVGGMDGRAGQGGMGWVGWEVAKTLV